MTALWAMVQPFWWILAPLLALASIVAMCVADTASILPKFVATLAAGIETDIDWTASSDGTARIWMPSRPARLSCVAIA
jgi:hypothetical protein